MSYNNDNNLSDEEIDEIERNVKERQEQEIREGKKTGKIPQFKSINIHIGENGNGNNNNNNSSTTSSNKEAEEGQQQKNKKKEIFSQKYAGKDYLAEAVFIGNQPYFAVSQKKVNDFNDFPSIILVEKIPLDEKTDLKPPEEMSYLNKPYIFESKEEFYEYVESMKEQNDLYSLFKQVKTIWKKYVDANDFHISICAADTIFSYLQDRIGLTHYLFFIGNNGSGKSNNLIIFHYLGYRNMMSTDVTAANIYQYLGNLQEGVGTLCEDEADNIDTDNIKMKIYKNGYVSGFPVFRMDTTFGRKQFRYFTFCIKAFAAERTPDSVKGKGFNQRVIELHCSPGFPQYDISEVINPAGEEEYEELLVELFETRKKLLVYRLLHFHDKIPDIKLNIENREKQLFKPIVRIFQNSQQVLEELLPVISNYVSQKRESNADTLVARTYQIIKSMIKENNSAELESSKIWIRVKTELNGEDIKPQTIETSEFGSISQKEIIKILKDVFKAKPPKRHGNVRSLVFDLTILEKLGQVYDLDINIQVKRKQKEDNENGTHGTHQQNAIGLDKHLFDEGNDENGTHGTHGTLYGDRLGLDKHISDTGIEENEENYTENNTKSLENSDNSSQTPSFEDENNPDTEETTENITKNNGVYSYNASQVSQASQMPISNTNINAETTIENIKGSHASKIDETITTTNLISCHYCNYTNSNEKEVERHSIISHLGKPARPDPNLLELIKKKSEK